MNRNGARLVMTTDREKPGNPVFMNLNILTMVLHGNVPINIT